MPGFAELNLTSALPPPESGQDRGRSRRSIEVEGVVQGVGFRPHIHGLALLLGLDGFVKNVARGVRIEVEGTAAALDRFEASLQSTLPVRARITALRAVMLPPAGYSAFRIERSDPDTARGPIELCADAATCAECVREMFDPADRRHLHPFICCTACGPRLTTVEATPYDRERTTMARFSMCAACLSEYEDPRSRRFHAQANSCLHCGPQLSVHDGTGDVLSQSEPLSVALRALSDGRIVAVKGLGGYHLACVATSERAVRALRERKRREEKPFAVMVAGLQGAEALCEISAGERDLLSSPERPIVLLRRREDARIAEAVAPGSRWLGVMLAYTPVHHLLVRGMGDAPLVMTSANESDEPILFEDAEAVDRLRGVADLFLVHDRDIHLRCDDSVARVLEHGPLVLRRARGYVPAWQPLPVTCRRPILALGGQLKSAFALGHDQRALLSHHLGDLHDHRAYRAYVDAITHYERLFRVTPALLVHDLHPDYASTVYASSRSESLGVPRLAVQHHHAHMVSCLAENGLTGPAIGVSFDGSGYGSDGAIWGGEFLVGDLRSFQRAGHLRYVALPGGERAIREPWRMALSHLVDAGADDAIAPLLAARVPRPVVAGAMRMIERGVSSPQCSSMGRLFDAAAALAGLRTHVTFEGQAAIDLEGVLDDNSQGTYPFDIEAGHPLVVDTRPLVRALAEDCLAAVPRAVIARRFHETVASIIETVCRSLRTSLGLETVALSGGVFQNAWLANAAGGRLRAAGFRVCQHRLVPPNDGGLAFGQLAIAAANDGEPSEGSA